MTGRIRRGKWPRRPWSRWWTTRSRRARTEDIMWSTRPLNKLSKLLYSDVVDQLWGYPLPNCTDYRLALLGGQAFHNCKLALQLKAYHDVLIQSQFLCTVYPPPRAYKCFSYFFTPYTAERRNVLGEKRFARTKRFATAGTLHQFPMSMYLKT